MAGFQPTVAAFFDQLTGALSESASAAHGEQVTISWLPVEARSLDLTWWSCSVSVDASCRLFAGAPEETWEVLGANPAESNFPTLMQAVQSAVQQRFGLQASCFEDGNHDEPAEDWTGAELSITSGSSSYPGLAIVLNPELLAEIGAAAGVPARHGAPNLSASDLLMKVEIPVSVALGRTQIRMKDLLALAHGSIVELDQQLSDDVEIRVNNCVIAHGEVVAVDGNYGVRILRMASGSGGRQ
jgi:flagellar motor switch protein FliN/FliY